ncbi:MAG: hypothetical protein JXB49_00060 [Bacteroidales bacterium]|nr:hypothetical protein [Bacteroidales bacterium]
MKENFIITEYQSGKTLILETPGKYSMDLAVEILNFMETSFNAKIKDTGWKQGYDLEIAVGLPIAFGNCKIELTTDGSGIWIDRISGNKSDFNDFCLAIKDKAKTK